uniref:Transmembrane protein n=1 Tax=Panagrellus redivivus TaxID=6233 RepID=A0A7E4VF20_PANRE
MDLPRRMAYSCLAVIILLQIQTISTETKVKRNDGVEIASTLGLTFQSPEPTEADVDKSAEAVQHHEFQRMAVLQNLNYMDDVITNLETERANLERMWKSTTAPGESQLQRAAKSLWQKTVKQLAVLHQKKLELVETLKSITFDENAQPMADSDNIRHELNVSSTTAKSPAAKEGASNLSKAICQFFVFGTLFGIVVTITICTCFLQPKQQRRRRHRVASISMNPSRIPEPFDYSKPCLLRADASGRFYASPLDSDEIPPLPTYEAALALPRSPSESTPAPSFEDVTSLQSIAVVSTPAPEPRDARY